MQAHKIRYIAPQREHKTKKADFGLLSALGKRLGEVSSVRYGNLNEDYYDGRVYDNSIGSPAPMGDAAPIDITPTDLNGCANVVVVWNLM